MPTIIFVVPDHCPHCRAGIGEAKALLHHTSWSTAEIAYSIGFEYPTYFNIFFKKHTGTTPLAFRRDT